MLDYLLLLVAFVRAAVGSRAEVAVENLLLRQQLAVLTRPTRKRPRLRRGDKVFWVLARRLWRRWSQHLAVVQPETVIRWHRQGWRLFWRWKSRPRLGTAAAERRGPRADRRDGAGQPVVGQRAHPGRAAQAGDRRQQALDPALPAARPRPPAEPDLAHVPRQPRPGDLGGGPVHGADARRSGRSTCSRSSAPSGGSASITSWC